MSDTRRVIHWGVAVSSDQPVTGVHQLSKLPAAFLDAVSQGIDLALEEHLAECQGQCAYCECAHNARTPGFEAGECDCARIGGSWIQSNPHEYVPSNEHDRCGPQERGTVLVGDWVKRGGKYEPVVGGLEGYAAIVSETTVQVVYSKKLFQGALCSPCFPGQVDLETAGDFLGFDLPDHLTRKD